LIALADRGRSRGGAAVRAAAAPSAPSVCRPQAADLSLSLAVRRDPVCGDASHPPCRRYRHRL